MAKAITTNMAYSIELLVVTTLVVKQTLYYKMLQIYP